MRFPLLLSLPLFSVFLSFALILSSCSGESETRKTTGASPDGSSQVRDPVDNPEDDEPADNGDGEGTGEVGDGEDAESYTYDFHMGQIETKFGKLLLKFSSGSGKKLQLMVQNGWQKQAGVRYTFFLNGKVQGEMDSGTIPCIADENKVIPPLTFTKVTSSNYGSFKSLVIAKLICD